MRRFCSGRLAGTVAAEGFELLRLDLLQSTTATAAGIAAERRACIARSHAAERGERRTQASKQRDEQADSHVEHGLLQLDQ